ncbi:MAG TPA: FAD-dependent oxidoreductase [Candidatus Kapabacteria bacterium]|nr:FAD-dependent oxidoreductase [Candidatus Kapabacteria bacterium]
MSHTSAAGDAPTLHIGIPGFSYSDLFDPRRLSELTDIFYASVRESDPDAWLRFDAYRSSLGEGMEPEAISDAILGVAPHLAAFLAEMFQIRDRRGRLRSAVESDSVVFLFKREFVTRRALKHYTSTENLDAPVIRAAVKALNGTVFADRFAADDPERATAVVVVDLMSLEKSFKHNPDPTPALLEEASALFARVAEARAGNPDLAAGLGDPREQAAPGDGVTLILSLYEQWLALEYQDYAHGHPHPWPSLRVHHTVDFSHLVRTLPPAGMPEGSHMAPDELLRPRDGFHLTDNRFGHRELMNEVEYCIYCHNRDRDSCSKGLREKDGTKKKNPLGITLNGCPLDEKISEFHTLKHGGDGLAAFAVIMIDNPMCPGTGHRICNDCMKACIYQKQEPVNIPQTETGMLTEVLDYHYGFEIYSLLTRWNPLNVRRPHMLPYNGKKVLVVGMGPAGYTLAHYLLNEGFGVVGIDGLKIEALPAKWTGSRASLPEPIADWRTEIYDPLESRVQLGFGGVAEYGITVRWDKNFLKVIYITLARHRTFQLYGGTRYGGTITVDDAWRLGFDHVAIATGAGKPTIVPMKNNLLRGIRQASDFLMALQLTGALKHRTLANLQLRLPAIVIGGGLTGVDTTTESMAYYPVQVERTLHRSEILIAEQGEERFWSQFGPEERETLEEFIAHGRAIREERERAAAEGREPNFIPLIRSWGGVSLVYRKSMQDSPAYRLNHEEVGKAMEEGIYFVENLSPVQAVPDEYGAVKEMIFERQALGEDGRWRSTGERVTMPARSVMVAAGTQPNTIIERETPGMFAYDEWNQYFAQYTDAPQHAEQAATA